ncbi:Gfo/Idh/MocA family protein [Hydrogenophaga sp.]|uniref:Gfo/Idh/MocA family protein n=1 Tax=Hydrogenophaga sp. TaxID=1904254 RepID=UPI0025C6594E|nr:Gfo/Idh/MocA family oxidoreductase [Hydrogenophaga sp.]
MPFSFDAAATTTIAAGPAPSALAHAVVGLGRFGSTHARKLAGLPGFHLRAVVDPFASRPQDPALGSVPLLRHVDELPSDIASATVATSDAAHAGVAIQLMARGCHVLVEKPLCLTASDGARMVQTARQQGVTLCTGHIERFNPHWHDARRAELREAARRQQGRPDPFLHFRRSSSRAGVAPDSVLDLMVHDLDLMAWLCAIPNGDALELIDRRVSASVVCARVQIGGLVAVFESGFGATAPEAVMQVQTESGPLVLDLRCPAAGRGAGMDPLCRQYMAFSGAIRGEPSPIATGDDGLAAVVRACRILEA